MIQQNLSEREKFNLGVALDKAVQELAQADPRVVCQKGAVTFNREQECYILPYLNRKYYVHRLSGEVKPLTGADVSIHHRVLFLHYLCHANGTPLTGEWITFKELPGGQIYIEPYQKRTIKPLLKYFGQRIEKFMELASSLGGEKASFGDASIIMRPLPRVPLGFIFWEGDEEFPPRANIIYDAAAKNYLPTEDYALLPGLIIWEMAALL